MIFPSHYRKPPFFSCHLLAKALLLSIALSSSFNLAAQTQFQIPAYSENLEQEHKAELSRWLLKAYEGDVEAQFRTGVLFANDQFDKPDYEQAIYWFTKAAQQGHALAQYNLGHYYLTGTGLAKDEVTAMSWWLKAAEQDHALAQFNIGRAYYIGIGIEKDVSLSRYWLQRAAYNQEPKSIEILQELGWEIGASNLAVEPPKPEAAAPEYATSNESAEASNSIVATANQIGGGSVALYTDPAIKSVLITNLANQNQLTVVEREANWLKVRKTEGFPVWVHSNFLRLAGDTATVVGNEINTRAAPLLSTGNIVGRLSNGESVRVLSQQSKWVQIQSPDHFTAWVKAENYSESDETSLTKTKWSISNQHNMQ